MTSPLVIALDAMGGDRAPQIVVRGAELTRENHPNVRFLMFGDQTKVEPLLSRLESGMSWTLDLYTKKGTPTLYRYPSVFKVASPRGFEPLLPA